MDGRVPEVEHLVVDPQDGQRCPLHLEGCDVVAHERPFDPHAEAFEQLCAEQGQLVVRLGTTGGDRLTVEDLFEVTVGELRQANTGVIEAARGRGLRIPEDLSVVGFDDTELARFSSPPLTTVRQPLREMGGVAVRTALRG